MKKLEDKVFKYLKARRWDNLRPSDIAKSIMIEGAELLELFQWDNLALNDVKANKEKIEQIKKELADVFIYAIEMSVLLDLDAEKLINEKLKYINKKYPAKLMRKNAKKESGSGEDSEYWRIKNEHRRSGL